MSVDQQLAQTYLSGGKIQSISKMGGLTNFVFKVTSDQGESIIYRIYSNYFLIFQDRVVETALQQELSKLSLAPRILYADSIQRIEEFFPYRSVNGDQIKQDYSKIAHLLGQVHLCTKNEPIKLICESQHIPSIKRHITNPALQSEISEILSKQTFTSKSMSIKLSEVFGRIFSEQVQQKILNLFDDESLKSLDLVLCHNDLNSTNFLLDDKLGQYHILDWENVGPNYPGYEIANLFKEMTWDYTHAQSPYFKIVQQNGFNEQEIDQFLTVYWKSYTGLNDQYPQHLVDQIKIGYVLQNYYWLMIGALSLKFDNADMEIDLTEYIKTRTRILEEFLQIDLWQDL